MCEGIYQERKDETDNLRILLQVSYERNNHLANIIHATNGFIVAILVGVIAYLGSIKNLGFTTNLVLIISICVVSLIIWRIYAHYIDNEIVSNYSKILHCENKLDIPVELSLLKNLIKSLPDKNEEKRKLEDFIQTKKVEAAYSKMFILVEEREIGSRGHLHFDIFAFSLCVLFLVVGIGLLLSNRFYLINIFFISGLIIGFLSGAIVLIAIFYPFYPIAKNP